MLIISISIKFYAISWLDKQIYKTDEKVTLA